MIQAADQRDIRGEIDAALAAGAPQRVRMLLKELWRRHPGAAYARYIAAQFDRLRSADDPPAHRLAILRSFTLEPAVPLLRAAAHAHDIPLEIHPGGFNAYAQEILNPGSELYRFDPGIVILAVQTRDVAPELWDGFAGLSPDEVAASVQRVVEMFDGLLTRLSEHSRASVILHLLDTPVDAAQGVLDAQRAEGQAEAIRTINRELRRLARSHSGVYVLDYDALVARHGRATWYDPHRWLTVRLPIAADCLMHLVNEWLRFLHPLTGRVCKALVVDLDNTLWGGVIGEDGLGGIHLGVDHPGAFYRDLQRAILDLYERGIILAIASKNNHDDAMEALEHHPGMLLRPEHVAAVRINWNDKARSLREIAAELNIGVDALAFLDDNPLERELVRSQLPEVTVIDLPDDPARYAAALRASPVFERLTLSAEDRERGRYYADQRLRTELGQSASSLEDFYWSLRQEVTVACATPETLTRVAQLTQKTNQFNLTTRRYTEQQIAAMMNDDSHRVYTVQVRDRFGDNGLTGVLIARCQAGNWEIDTFLLSCRVMGRTVETALLAAIADEARAEGARTLTGWYLPTKKNVVVADLYASHGFRHIDDRGAASAWQLDLGDGVPSSPPWITIRMLTRGIYA